MTAGTSQPRASRIRLLAVDVDGTLTDSRHELPEATRQAVQRIRAAGIRVMLATGRRYRDALPVHERLGIDDAPLVTASGALVKRPPDHATLWRADFAAGVVAGVIARIVAAGHEPVVYTDSFAAGFDFHCRRLPDAAAEPGGLAEYMLRNRHLADVRPDLHAAPPDGVFAGFAMGGEAAMRALETELDAAFPGALEIHVIRSPRYRDWLCEVAPAGVTKWSGVAAVAAQWGIAAAEICAVGDDVNDLPMIRGAGLGIAMGNARPEVKAVADTIVGTHDASGLTDVADLLLAGLA
jgi:hydroxymethylpyrimidine pyrophosphatase-like HAD family hydrolase